MSVISWERIISKSCMVTAHGRVRRRAWQEGLSGSVRPLAWTGVSANSSYMALGGTRAVNDPAATNVAQIVISGTRRLTPGRNFDAGFRPGLFRHRKRGGCQLCDHTLWQRAIQNHQHGRRRARRDCALTTHTRRAEPAPPASWSVVLRAEEFGKLMVDEYKRWNFVREAAEILQD